MRANSSIPSVIVVVLLFVCACTRADNPTAVHAPPEPLDSPPAPQPVVPVVDQTIEPALEEALVRAQNVPSGPTHGVSNAAGPAHGVINQIVDREASSMPSSSRSPTRTIDKLIYQCTDDITFAITVRGSRLQVFPPGYSNGFIVLEQATTDDGVRYVGYDAEFRAKGELATLRVGRARYVDCVSNPAAAVWQEPLLTR